MFECSTCGLPGAQYCPITDDYGEPLDGYYHHGCYAQKGTTEYTTLGCPRTYSKAVSLIPARSFVGTRPPYRKGPTMLQVRLQAGGVRQCQTRRL